jgi:hypothetical protein
MLLRTFLFLLLASFLLSGVVNGRRLTDQRTLEKDLFVATNEVTHPNLPEVQEKQQSNTTRLMEEGEEEPQQKAGNDGHDFETATHSPNAFNISGIADGKDEEDIFSPAASLDVFKNVS